MSVYSAQSESADNRTKPPTRSVCLLLPGLLQSVDQRVERAALPVTCRLLSRAAAGDLDGRTLEQLAMEWFNVPSSDGASCAARLGVCLDGATSAPLSPPGGSLFRADPVYQQIELHSVLLGDPDLLELSTDEAQSLIVSLNAHLAADGLQLWAHSPQRWYLQASGYICVKTTDINAAIGHNIARHQTAGEDAGKWQRLLTECQMILFDHPVNRQRERHGKLPVNSLWLWGEGDLPQSPADTIERRVGSDDFYTQSLAHFRSSRVATINNLDFGVDAATLIVDRRLQTALNTGDGALRHSVLGELEQTVFEQLWSNLSTTRVCSLNLWTGRRWWHCDYRARRSFWRRARPFEFFIESANEQ